MQKLFAFSDEFYTVEFDDYEYGLLGAADMEDAQRQLPSSELDIIEIGQTDLDGILLLGRRSRPAEPEREKENVKIDCLVYTPVNPGKIETVVAGLRPNIGVPIENYRWARFPAGVEPFTTNHWLLCANDDSVLIPITTQKNFEDYFFPGEETVCYECTRFVGKPSFYQVLINVLTYVGRAIEYHYWARQARFKWFSLTYVEGWERVVEKIDGRYEQVWFLNPAFREELPAWVREEASNSTVKIGADGNPRMVKF
ncbi:hypothetical protein pEaSNUABM29_00201 [Erwinia phage pEa_SNUABM_29]|nr:hypothetical protein pEaSNUABM29_00201 [Erwinia phage pEa_SNUABM_29]